MSGEVSNAIPNLAKETMYSIRQINIPQIREIMRNEIYRFLFTDRFSIYHTMSDVNQIVRVW